MLWVLITGVLFFLFLHKNVCCGYSLQGYYFSYFCTKTYVVGTHYRGIIFLISAQKRMLWVLITGVLFFLFLHKNVCCGYSLQGYYFSYLCTKTYVVGTHYRGIIFLISAQKRMLWVLITGVLFFLSLHKNVCCGYSLQGYYFSYFCTKTYVVGTHYRGIIFLISAQKRMLWVLIINK